MNVSTALRSQSLVAIQDLIDPAAATNSNEWFNYATLNEALECGRRDVALQLLLGLEEIQVNEPLASPDLPRVTPLHRAVKLGDQLLVKLLLDREASVTAFDFDGNTPLHLAFIFKRERIVDLLLTSIELNSTFVNCTNKQGLGHLHIAATRKKNCRVLLEGLTSNGADIEQRVHDDSLLWPGYTALHFAVEFESLAAAEFLLERSSSSDRLDGKGRTPLRLLRDRLDDLTILADLLEKKQEERPRMSFFEVACARGEPRFLLERFIEHGSKVNDENPSAGNYSPLHFAVSSGKADNVELLLERGADPRLADKSDMTPLHLGLYREEGGERSEVVDKLYAAVEDKLDDDRADRNGLSYFHVAVTRNDVDVVESHLDKGISGVDDRVERNHLNFSNFSPLHLAVAYRNLEVARMLIERGANVDADDCKGENGTPLHVACEVGDVGMIELLLENKANVGVKRGADLQTPLHVLAETYRTSRCEKNRDGLMGCVEKIVGLGCDVDARDVDGDTALHLLRWETDDTAMSVRLLLRLGADVNLKNDDGYLPFDAKYWREERLGSEEYKLFLRHVEDLRRMGREVDPRHDECCRRMMMMRDGKLELEC